MNVETKVCVRTRVRKVEPTELLLPNLGSPLTCQPSTPQANALIGQSTTDLSGAIAEGTDELDQKVASGQQGQAQELTRGA